MEGFLKYGASIYLYTSLGPADDQDSVDEQIQNGEKGDQNDSNLKGFISCKG